MQATKKIKTVVWLEDNPDTLDYEINDIKKSYEGKLDIKVWDGNYKGSLRGLKCIEDFQKNIEEASNIVGFILDMRIPMEDLSILGLPNIKNETGLISGIQIALYYLHNKDGDSPLGDRFKNTPVLFFTVAGGVKNRFSWVDDEQQKYRFLEKTTPENFDELKKWLKQFV